MDLNQLILNAQNGDSNSMEEIINRFKPYIISLCKKIYLKNYDMDDLIQIGCLSLIKVVKGYDVEKANKFVPYATCAIRNNYYYEIRQKSRCNDDSSLNLELDDGFQLIDTIFSKEDVEASVLMKNEIAALNLALSKLSPIDREIINYVFINNGKLVEYAKAKNIKYATSVKRKNSAIKRLKKLFTSIT